MKRPTRRQLIIGGTALVIVAAVVFAFLPDPLAVDMAEVTRARLEVVVEEEGETSIENRYVVTSPVAAFARRIELEPGDPVVQGQALVQLEAPRAASLDPGTRAQAEAHVQAAAAAVENAAVTLQRAQADEQRMETLFSAGAVTRRETEEARAAAVRANAALNAARADLAGARAAARASGSGTPSGPDVLRAPAAGRVLAVHRRSEGHVNPGEPLLEVGDTRGIEIRADVLSQDAVRIHPGTRVIVDQWGGDRVLDAVVTLVEPEGVTKVSALGVEEQRVTVRASITSPTDHWEGLGSGYRVLARFIVWESADVLQAPTAALFRNGDVWAVYAVENGRATLREVSVGQQAGLSTQILQGLDEGTRVVIHPPNAIEDGARVRQR